MAGPWARIIAQLAVSVGGVFARAFARALQDAQRAGGAAGAASREVSQRFGGMSTKEAMRVLNVEESALTHENITNVCYCVCTTHDLMFYTYM